MQGELLLFTLVPNLSAQVNGGALGLQLLALWNKKVCSSASGYAPRR